MSVNELAASTLVGVARDMGAPVPKGVSVDGRVVGWLVQFAIRAARATCLSTTDQSSCRMALNSSLAEASLLIQGDSIKLAPAALVGEEGQGAQFEGEYNSGDSHTRCDHLRSGPSSAEPHCSSFGRSIPGRQLVRGAAVSPGRCAARGLDRQLRRSRHRNKSARRRETGTHCDRADRYRRRCVESTPDAGVTGRRRILRKLCLRSGRSSSASISISLSPQAAIADVESLLAPAMRRDEGFFARTLRLRRAQPPNGWRIEKRKARSGSATLTAGDTIARGVRSRVVWDGGSFNWRRRKAVWKRLRSKATGMIDITKSEPQYKLLGRVQNVAWKNGKVDLEGSLQTLGSGLDLLLNLRGEGTFQAHGVVLSPDQTVRAATGDFALIHYASGPQFKLSDVQASLGTERFTGDGITLADGRLQMELASANRTVRVNVDSAR